MGRKSVAIICNTAYQLIVVLQMKLTVLKNMDVDLFISDWSVDANKYVKNAKKLKLFRDIKYVETLKYCKRLGEYERGDVWQELRYTLERYRKVKKIVGGEVKRYDYYFNANMNVFECAFYDVLKQKNRNLKLYMFDDGLATYQTMGVWLQNRWKDIVKGKYAGIYKLTKYGEALKNIKGVFMFTPEFCCWENMKFYKIPKISFGDVDTINRINTLFGYVKSNNIIEGKVIYFEDGLYEDGWKVNDVRLLNIIAECVGKENILVKTHPRSRKDRFPAYKKFSDISIPWEVFYLNNNFDDVRLVTLLSSAVVHLFLLFDDKREVVLLWDVVKGDFKRIMEPDAMFMKKTIFLPHSDIYRLIKDEEDLRDYFRKYANELAKKKENC